MSNSWSGVRKRLEQDLLCPKLRGRVQYFLTHYHGAPDNYGRFAVRLDGREIVFANPYNERYTTRAANDAKSELNETRRWWELYETDRPRYDEIFRRADLACIERGELEIYHVTDALREYLQAPIRDALFSENPAVRMFAVLDRRIGKRTLSRLAGSVGQQPDWLRPFYCARLAAEDGKPVDFAAESVIE